MDVHTSIGVERMDETKREEDVRIGSRSFRADLEARLRRGQHRIVYGPRGSGKSTLLRDIEVALRAAHVPCGRAPETRCLGDITAAFERAYPEVDARSVTRRRARARLRMAADRHSGVLLLDHVTQAGTAMVGCLRRLRGGLVGVLLAVDVDSDRERDRMRGWHLALSERMPTASAGQLRRLFRLRCAQGCVAPIPPHFERHIIRAARGRPGWIELCAKLAKQPDYWWCDVPLVNLLCIDCEIALRGAIPSIERDSQRFA